MATSIDRTHQLVYTDKSGKFFDVLTGDEVFVIPQEEVPLWGYFLNKNGEERHIAELFYGATPDLRESRVIETYFIDSLNRETPAKATINVLGHRFYKIVADVSITEEGAFCSQLIAKVSSPTAQGDIYANTFHICGNMSTQELSFNTGLFQVSSDMAITLEFTFNTPNALSIPIYGTAKLLGFY